MVPQIQPGGEVSREEHSESHARLSNLIGDIKGRMHGEQPSEIMRLRTIIENVAESLERDQSPSNVKRCIGILRGA